MASSQRQLSSTVLDMKFMRRTKNKLEEKEKKTKEEQLKNVYLSGEKIKKEEPAESESSNLTKDQYIFTRDLQFLEDLSFGRFSFNGMNPEVEKLMKYYEAKKNGTLDEEEDNEVEISDGEMAMQLRGSLSSTIGNKFKKKAERGQELLIDESPGDRMEAKKGHKRQAPNNNNKFAKRGRMW